MRQETHTSGALARHLPTFLIVLMAIQPLMDTAFWLDKKELCPQPFQQA